MDSQGIEQLALEIKQFFGLDRVTFIKEVHGDQYFEAAEKNGIIKRLRFNHGKLFFKENGNWVQVKGFFIRHK